MQESTMALNLRCYTVKQLSINLLSFKLFIIFCVIDNRNESSVTKSLFLSCTKKNFRFSKKREDFDFNQNKSWTLRYDLHLALQPSPTVCLRYQRCTEEKKIVFHGAPFVLVCTSFLVESWSVFVIHWIQFEMYITRRFSRCMRFDAAIAMRGHAYQDCRKKAATTNL